MLHSKILAKELGKFLVSTIFVCIEGGEREEEKMRLEERDVEEASGGNLFLTDVALLLGPS